MTTWAAFLTDDIAERWLRVRSVAAVLSGLLHAGLVGAAFAELPWTSPQPNSWGIDVTVELAPQVEEVTSSMLEAHVVMPEPAPATHLLLSEPVPVEPPSPEPAREAMLAPAIESPPSPRQTSAALSPEQPSLDTLLPAAEAPPSVDAHDFARAKPAPARPPAPPRVQAAAIQPQSVKRPAPDARPPVAAMKNDHAQQKAEEDYFWQLVRKISQYRFYSRSPDNAPRGLVVTRMTIAPDGRLLDVALLKSSGFPTLDKAVVDTIRQASPFAPLPGDLAQGQKTFVVPVNYTREH